MGSVDRVDDRTFRSNFTVDGVAKLRERVKEKLKEFMGDYTDDTLVEYVIVLLRNGRRKEEARNELNVFLGDDSDSFVSWLWDHLALNIDLYVESQDEAPKRKLISEVQVAGDGSQHLNSESERGKSSKLSRSRHNKDWKGLVREGAEPPPLRSSEVDSTYLEEKIRHTVSRDPRSPSPPPTVRRKRSRPEEKRETKRDAVSHVTISATRRLLQSAVRDAVATSRPSNSGTPAEPSLKRLRSVVSTSSGDSSLVERPQRIQTISKMPNPMATVIKAVAEAAEDVRKFKPSGSVFDRLGRSSKVLDDRSQLDDDYPSLQQNQSQYFQGDQYDEPYAANKTMLDHQVGFPSDSTSDNEVYDDVNVMGQRVTSTSQIGSSGRNRGDDSLMVQYSVAKNADDSMHLKRRDQERPVAAPNTSHKIVNISVNVNTWKPPQYQESREVAEVDSETGAPRPGLRLMKDNANPVKISNGNGIGATDTQKESQKTPLLTSGPSAAAAAAARPLEDADSRTIFVSNVHFAATKDSLSRHFNKFGEVLKVIIVTDAATGQPKGCAYVEFMRKEAADNALTLDGTSFMSRILKVVKKSAGQQESAPTMVWPRMVRSSPYPARFSRVPFPRGIPGAAFRPRPPFKLGARSMQWKRDAQGTQTDSGSSLNVGSVALPAARSLTYVRTESKPVGSMGTT